MSTCLILPPCCCTIVRTRSSSEINGSRFIGREDIPSTGGEIGAYFLRIGYRDALGKTEKRVESGDQLKFRFKIHNKPIDTDSNMAIINVNDRGVVLLIAGVVGENSIRVANGSPAENSAGPIT
tara:strand:+ start:464 stop:835 length:372 start_codon:yes stop_codon:yes gene_type:complete